MHQVHIFWQLRSHHIKSRASQKKANEAHDKIILLLTDNLRHLFSGTTYKGGNNFMVQVTYFLLPYVPSAKFRYHAKVIIAQKLKCRLMRHI